MRRLKAKADFIAFMSQGAPSQVIAVGMHNLLFAVSFMKESRVPAALLLARRKMYENLSFRPLSQAHK